jgi:hypothetical protein
MVCISLAPAILSYTKVDGTIACEGLIQRDTKIHILRFAGISLAPPVS